jgi:hypothetical protein
MNIKFLTEIYSQKIWLTYECHGHTVHKLIQRRLTADWLAPRKSDCTRMRSKVSSDWLSSYIKATRPVLEIYKMAEYFSDNSRKSHSKGFNLQPY